MAPNDRWSLDFVLDQLTDGRRFRILTVVDDCIRVPGAGGRYLALRPPRGAETAASDNGSELTSNAILTVTR
jgi:putative transposase